MLTRLKKGDEIKIAGIKRNLKILKFEVSFFVFFNIEEINFYRLNSYYPSFNWKFVSLRLTSISP